MLTKDEAMRQIRADPRCEDLVRDAYLGEDVREAADRFRHSAEFEEVLEIVRPFLERGRLLDLGAGNGIASYALAHAGAGLVLALDPDPSDEVGIGVLRALTTDLSVAPLVGVGERMPLRDESIDVVYIDESFHHASDLPLLLKECARVLKSGGTLLACREHVVDNDRQLQAFLNDHPVHQLAGGEHAFTLPEYLEAIREGGLVIRNVLRPWDSVINAYPAVRATEELRQKPRAALTERFGRFGGPISRIPGVHALAFAWLNRSQPGRLYTFVAIKP